MLWDIVFEFYVTHIFGGLINSVEYGGILGDVYNTNGTGWVRNAQTATYTLTATNFNILGLSGNYKMPIGNYLSMIATIVTLVIIVTLCALFVYKIIKLIGGLIR